MNKLPTIAAVSLLVMIVIAVLERLTSVFSTALAEKVCGERYMELLGGVISEQSCGFNADVYCMAALVLAITVALVVLLFTL